MKSELSAAVAERHQILRILRKDAEAAVDAVFAAIAEALKRGDRIELRGFGVFTVKERQARNGHNPQTGGLISIPAKCVSFFKVAKELRERMR